MTQDETIRIIVLLSPPWQLNGRKNNFNTHYEIMRDSNCVVSIHMNI